jgi:hypothetical protein
MCGLTYRFYIEHFWVTQCYQAREVAPGLFSAGFCKHRIIFLLLTWRLRKISIKY